MANSLSGVYNANKEEGASRRSSFSLPIDVVKCDWTENIRPRDDEHVASWRNTIQQGDYVPAILVEMREGEPWVIEGFHRYDAHVEEGTPSIECKEWKGTDADKLITMRASTGGKPLTFLQDAEVILGIKEKTGLSPEKLGQRLGISRTAVNNKIAIAEAEDAIKTLIIEEKIAATEALKFIIEHGADALKHINHALDKAILKGAKKVTPRGAGTPTFSAAKFRNIAEITLLGVDDEDFVNVPALETEDDVELVLTLPKRDAIELLELLDEYNEFKEGKA